MTRTRRRRGPARLLAVATLLVLAAGCSAGQITQTANQVPAVPGANVTVGDIALRDVVVVYNDPDGYPAGGDAALVVRIFNNGLTPVTLVGASATASAASVELVGAAGPTSPPLPASPTPAPTPPEPTSPAPGPPTSPSPAPQSTPPQSTPPQSTPPATPDGPPAGPGPGPGASASAPAPAPGGGFALRIEPGSYLLLIPGQGPYLRLTGLTQALTPGSSVPVTFAFAGGVSVAVTVPFGLPTVPAPRPSPPVPEPGGEAAVQGE